MTTPALIRWLLLLVSLVAPLAAQTAWTVGKTNLLGVDYARQVAFGNGRFVATVGNSSTTISGGGTAWSTDGVTWQFSTTRTPTGVAVVFANGTFFYAGDSDLWRSTDGDTWQWVRGFDGRMHTLATDGRSVLVTMDNRDITLAYLSTDLVTWRETTALPGISPSHLLSNTAYANGRYYVRYYNTTSGHGVSSTNGSTWSLVPTLDNAISFTGGNGRIVGVGSAVFTTTDGSTFTNTNLTGSVTAGSRLGYAGGRFFLLGSLYASFDGTTWASLASGAPNSSLTGIAYGNGRYVAVGYTTGTGASDVVAVLVANAPPVITSEPADQVVIRGATATFQVGIDNSALATTYQWQRNNVPIAGATAASYTINSVDTAQLGSYSVVVRNAVGTVTSVAATLAFATPPAILASSQNTTISEGSLLTLFVGAVGLEPFTYQWFKNGTAIAGATDQYLIFGAIRTTDAGTYYAVVSNIAGSTVSPPAVVTVRTVTIPPSVLSSTAPPSVAIQAGERVTFSITVDGTPPLSIQWQRSGQNIPGATNTTLVLDPALPSDLGTYQAIVSNAAGSVYSTATPIVVTPISRIANLSVLTALSSPGDNFSLGFVVGGIGTSGTKPVIARAAGPSLAAVGVAGALDDPALETFAGAVSTGTNDNWGGSATLVSAFASVGAFPFSAGSSKDAAVLSSLAAGDNSVKVTSTAGAGTVLAEVYDASPALSFIKTTPRLLNVSVLKSVGSGFTVGFTLVGWNSKTILIRAVGPTLGAAPFNVPGVLADPQLRLFANQTLIASNDNWGGSGFVNTMYTDAFAKVGAFALPVGSRDAAWLTTLDPGGYSVQVSGVGTAQGLVLVEIYEVP